MRRRPLARYLVQIALTSALINFALNVVLGKLFYDSAGRIPLAGRGSIGNDTFINAFFIGFGTFALLFAQSAREARSGRVHGGASVSKLLGWIARHHVISAALFGLFLSFAVALPGLILLRHFGILVMGGARFIWCKSLFAAAVAILASVAAALPAIAREPRAADDERWCQEPRSDEPSWPCDYVDKGGLSVTNREHGCSGTPTWQLMVHGTLDPAHVAIALDDTITRYPPLATRVQALDGVPPEARRYRYAHQPQFTADRLLTTFDLRRQPERLAAVEHEQLNRHTDLFVDPPLTLALILVDDEHCRLVFRQHHAIADGRAFIELLGDFVRFLDDARAGRRPSAEALAPIGRRGELEALALRPWRRAWWTLGGLVSLIVATVRALRSPPVQLPQNRSNDYRGDNGTVHFSVGEEVLDGWNAARKRDGVSLNSLLTAALFAANQRRQRTLGGELGRCSAALVMETRPRDGNFRSFANHMATLVVESDLSRADDVTAIARHVQADVDEQRRHHRPIKRLLGERLVVLALPLVDLQRIVFSSKNAAHNFHFSNLIPLPFPTLAGAGFTVDEVRITTPVTPRAGIVITVIRYNGRVTFNFNYKSSAASREEATALLQEFRAALRDATGVDA